MKFGKAFTYMFDDPEWVSKYTIGIVISLVPILNLAWIGYAIGIMRNIAKGIEHPLPAWDDIGGKFKDGLFVALAGFVYTLPLSLVACLVYGVAIIPALFSGDDIGSAMAAMSVAVWVILGCCAFVYLLLFSFLVPAMMIHYSREGSFKALFQIKEIFQLATRNIGDYLLGWLAGFVAGAILGLINVIPCIGWLITIVAGAAWINTVTAYAYGNVGMALSAAEDSYRPPA